MLDVSGPALDAEAGAVHEQLIVFARELGELYRLERSRSEQLEHALEGLQETYLATMKSLACVVEAKDMTTRSHLDRTHSYGLSLAAAIDPDLADTPELGFGFFLHDIGKVGIPEGILRKPGPLSEEEWDVMRRHPDIGAEIVAPIRSVGNAVKIIRHHHERFDGNGYPNGLRSGDIPLVARIFSVVDSFDAMTSDRPYRRAMSVNRALEEILENAGSQFDPEVVQVFLNLVDEQELLGQELLGEESTPVAS